MWQIWLVWFFNFFLFPTFLKYENRSCWHWKLQKLNQASGKQMVSKCSFTPSYPLFFGMWEGWVQGQKLHKTLIILRERRSGVFLHWWCFLHQDLVRVGTFVFILCWFFSTFSGSFIKGVLWFRSHWTCEENNAVPKGPLSGKLTSIAYHRASFSFVDSRRTKGNFVEGKTTTFAKVSAISPHAG